MQDRFSADKFVAVNVQRSPRSEEPRQAVCSSFVPSSNRLNGRLLCGNLQYMLILTLLMQLIETKKDT